MESSLPEASHLEDLGDHVGVELVAEANAAVLVDDAGGELLRPDEQRVPLNLDGFGLEPGPSAFGER